MSKRVKNRKGKRGRTIHNTQWCKEHGTLLSKRMRPKVEIVDDKAKGFF